MFELCTDPAGQIDQVFIRSCQGACVSIEVYIELVDKWWSRLQAARLGTDDGD